MRSIFDASTNASLIARLRSLSPQSTARWGRMTVHQMVCHLGDQIRCALGDISTSPRWTPLRIPPLRFVFVHWLPWPKGLLPTLPEMQSTKPDGWEADLAAAEELLRRAAERGLNASWAEHGAFGRLSAREWGWIIYKHTDHHLRQFGA